MRGCRTKGEPDTEGRTIERVMGDSVPCYHCGAEVVLLVREDDSPIGWLHPSGLVRCGPRSTWPTKGLRKRVTA